MPPALLGASSRFDATLIRQALSGHIAGDIGARGIAMDGKARIILVTTMTSIMVLMVTLISTFINLGLARDFFAQWAKAYFVSWPIAAITGYLVMPMARRFTARVMARLDGTA